MVVVSHDRYFLDKVINKVWELHFGRITVYPGNYSQYWRLRTEKAKVLERQAERQDEKAAELEAYIRKYGAGQRAKQAHDRERKLERLERDRVETIRDVVGPVMRFDEVERSGDIVIEARRLSKSFDARLFRDLSLTVGRGECVGVIGPNGAGKTTLIKTLIGREKPDQGEVEARAQGSGRLPRPGFAIARPRHHRGPRRLARRRSRMGGRRRPRPARPVRPVEASLRFRPSASSPAARKPRPHSPGSAPPRPTCWSWTSRPTTSTSGRENRSSARSTNSRAPSWS